MQAFFSLNSQVADVEYQSQHEIDAVGVGSESFAVLMPKHASEDKGPFTVYRYRAEAGKTLSYERVKDTDLIAQVLKASRE
ncbi:hypothetical protein D7Y21_08620 [Corallococcus sp. AB045]|uniref:hypothetical protein n=1 Tax=Corallococcus sp. AB045 TaxID=2316719 RepID=UPI000EEC9D13|nr:hypothetical protein [Corallococcus sp. AB045]RKH89882.1 hypothetical protein D7Y21_08620 [Corallococcus sp. AB045]